MPNAKCEKVQRSELVMKTTSKEVLQSIQKKSTIRESIFHYLSTKQNQYFWSNLTLTSVMCHAKEVTEAKS